jgi:predicted porin
MNKNIKLAVAGAILATASVANAGIVIPAGDWTLDIGGIVNTYATWTKADSVNAIRGGLAGGAGKNTVNNMTTGLLPNYLSVSGTTRQNDLDVSFTISINPGSSTTSAGNQDSNQENRQAFLTFGDKSWGSIKVGKDLGIYASDAILNDMTLLGVGSGAGLLAGNQTTLGRIGTGFMYADWKAQIAYTTPNFNGFQATVGLTQAWDQQSSTDTGLVAGTPISMVTTGRGGASSAYEGKASYSFAANDVTGKVWVSGLSQKVDGPVGVVLSDSVAYSADIGANVNVAGFGLTGYYYGGSGIGRTVQFVDGYSVTGRQRDSDGGYVQATYVLPTKTKVGFSWGESNLDQADAADRAATAGILVRKNEMYSVGVYHPLTKHLNLVAEWNHVKSENQAGAENKANTGSLGAILFF